VYRHWVRASGHSRYWDGALANVISRHLLHLTKNEPCVRVKAKSVFIVLLGRVAARWCL
jgi:hypothetical protein